MANEETNSRTGAPKENSEKSASSFRTNVFKSVKSISDKLSMLLGKDTSHLKEIRKQTRDLSLQVRLTKKSMKENRFRFDKIAESNQAVAEALKAYDNVDFSVIENVEQLLAQNKEIPAELGAQYKQAIQLLNESLKPLQNQEGIEVNLGSVMDEVAKIVADRSVATDTRASFITDFIKLMEKQENLSLEQKQILEILVDEAKRGLVLNDSQTDDMGAIFELLKSNKIDDVKMQGTVASINHIAGKLLMSSRNIEDKIDQSQFSIKDLLDKLEKGLGAEGMDLGDLIFAALGIPGLLKTVSSMKNFGGRVGKALTDIFGKDGGIAKFIKNFKTKWNKVIDKGTDVLKVFSKEGAIGKVFARIGSFASKVGGVFKTIGGFFGKISKAFKPLMSVLKVTGATVGGTLLGPVVAIIGGIMSLFDAVSGFFNADEISGKTEEMVTLGDRIQAAISGFISGLSFGFISAETIFKKIDEAQAFMGEIWDDTGKVFSDFVDAITNFFMSDEGFMGTVKKIAEKFTNFKVSNIVPDWIANAVGMGGDEPEVQEADTGRFANTPAKKEAVISSLQPARGKTFASNDSLPSAESIQAFKKEEAGRTADTAKAMAKIIPVPMPQKQASPTRTISKSAQIDDMQLSAINVGLMD